MDRFIKWMQKKAFDNVTIEPVKYGSDYFKKADPVLFDAVMVSIPFDRYYCKASQLERMIVKYATRYGYMVYYRGYNLHGIWFTVCKPADAAALALYYEYQDRSIKQYEIVAHNYYIGRLSLTGRTLNDIAGAIMDKWEKRYINALREIKTA